MNRTIITLLIASYLFTNLTPVYHIILLDYTSLKYSIKKIHTELQNLSLVVMS